jgi:hypothetical protein
MHPNTPGKACGGLERHRAHSRLVKVTVNFENEVIGPVPLHDQGRINRWQVGMGKDDIHDSPSDGMHDAIKGLMLIR